MGSSSKTKRIAIANEDDNNKDDADMEIFNEIVEKFRGPYNWWAKHSALSTDFIRTIINGNDRKKRKTGEEKIHKRNVDVWMPQFVLEDFSEDMPTEFGKSSPKRSETTTEAEVEVEIEMIKGGGEKKKDENNKELDLNLSLSLKIN